MKKVGLGLSLTVLALGFLISPALAASPPQAARVLSAADQAFLASLSTPARTPAATHAANRPRTGRTGGEKSQCSAQATCRDNSTVSCQGNSSCSAVDSQCPWGEGGHVTCDGVTTWCIPCPFNCADAEWNCYRGCYPCNYNFSCDESGPSCDCQWSTCPP